MPQDVVLRGLTKSSCKYLSFDTETSDNVMFYVSTNAIIVLELLLIIIPQNICHEILVPDIFSLFFQR